MFLGLLFIVFWLFCALFFKYILPVMVAKKIFKVQMTKGEFLEYVAFCLFIPISLLFSKLYYNHLKKQNIISGVGGFLKVMGSVIGIVIIFGVLWGSFATLKPFQVSGQSMSPSLYDKQFVLAEVYSTDYQRGDVVVFNQDWKENPNIGLKRIIGVPGDILKIEGGDVYISQKGQFELLDELYLLEENKGVTFIQGSAESVIYEVPVDNYFVMGDNRGHSTDSRECFGNCVVGEIGNFVPWENITGRIFFDLGYYNFKSYSFTHPNLEIDTTPKFFDGAF